MSYLITGGVAGLSPGTLGCGLPGKRARGGFPIFMVGITGAVAYCMPTGDLPAMFD